MDAQMRELERRFAKDLSVLPELHRVWQRLRDPFRDPIEDDVLVAPGRGWDRWTHEQREHEERLLRQGLVRAFYHVRRPEDPEWIQSHSRTVSVPGCLSWGRWVRRVILPTEETLAYMAQVGRREPWQSISKEQLRAWYDKGTVYWERVTKWEWTTSRPGETENRKEPYSCSLKAWRAWCRSSRPVREPLVLRMGEERQLERAADAAKLWGRSLGASVRPAV